MQAQPSGLLVQLTLYRPEKNEDSEWAGVTQANDQNATDKEVKISCLFIFCSRFSSSLNSEGFAHQEHRRPFPFACFGEFIAIFVVKANIAGAW